MAAANNSVNLAPGQVPPPLINQCITLQNGALTATTTSTAVAIGDDYYHGYAVLVVSAITVTSTHVQIYGSDTNSSITSQGSLVYDFGVISAPGVYFTAIDNLVPSLIPASGPTPETAIYQYMQVLSTIAGSGTVDQAVLLFI